MTFTVQKGILDGQISETFLHCVKCFSLQSFQMHPGNRSEQFFNTKYFKVTNYVGNLINASVIFVFWPLLKNLPLIYQSCFEKMGAWSFIFQSSCGTKENFVHLWCLRTAWAETEKLAVNAVYLQRNYRWNWSAWYPRTSQSLEEILNVRMC